MEADGPKEKERGVADLIWLLIDFLFTIQKQTLPSVLQGGIVMVS